MRSAAGTPKQPPSFQHWTKQNNSAFSGLPVGTPPAPSAAASLAQSEVGPFRILYTKQARCDKIFKILYANKQCKDQFLIFDINLLIATPLFLGRRRSKVLLLACSHLVDKICYHFLSSSFFKSFLHLVFPHTSPRLPSPPPPSRLPLGRGRRTDQASPELSIPRHKH